MPWLAQRPDLPDTHKHWADPGSELERVYVRLGYVEVPAPGSAEPDEQGLDQQPVTDVATAAADRPKRGSGRA